MPKIFLTSLGCAKNLVDSEHMLGLIVEGGYDITDDPSRAETAVVNTCAFIQSAVEESIDIILELAALKERGALGSLVVVGCLVQRYGKKLMREMPEVDGWLGTGQIHRIGELLRVQNDTSPIFLTGKPDLLLDHSAPKLQATPFYSAYLKIAEGCSHRCSYCIIPSLRGRFRSRTVDSLYIEAKQMVERGVQEINLVAQDTTSYGHDLNPPRSLEDLLEKLLTIPDLEWIRILYAHPYHVTERLLDLIDSEEVLCPYLDIPIQHVDADLLSSMGRPLESESIPHLIERVRLKSRTIALRTTVMVGFPGETHKRFKKLCEFVEAAKFDRLGVFSFSPEEGAPAARFRGRIAREVAQSRAAEIMHIQAENSRELNRALVGKTLPVLIEGSSPETDLLLTGRTATMAPDVDGQVLINKGSAVVGEIAPVRITKAHTYDLVGSIERKEAKQKITLR